MILRALLSIGLGVCLAGSAAAQLATQTALVGTVTDTSGSVIPGATVVAVNTATQDTYETTTNAQGYYNLQFVRIGKYEITVTLPGFQTFKATGIQVATNQIVRVDAVLQVGGMTDTVTVAAAAVMLATDSAEVSTSIGELAVAELPIRGRNVWDLSGTTPGVLFSTGTSASSPGVAFFGAGQRDIQSSLNMDGISTVANLVPVSSVRPIADAVTEVQVQTGSTSAEYGSYLGVHVNVVTKSGTNNPHGNAYWYLQSDALDARQFFEDRNTPPNPRRLDQFGFEMDGPVVIPGLYDGRNRTFFMAASEGIRDETLRPALESVPTERMRQGDFSEVSRTIRNPFTGVAYPNNIIPQSELSPIALRLLEYYPLPNRPGTGANFYGNSLRTNDVNQLLTRVDQNIGNQVRLSVRYNWQDESNYDDMGALGTSGNTLPQTNKNTLVSYTQTLRSNLFNDFRMGYHRHDFNILGHFLVNDLLTAGADLGIPGFDSDVAFNNPGLPSFSPSGFSGLGDSSSRYQYNNTFQISNVVAYNRGGHNIRAGFDTRRLVSARSASNQPRGTFSFNGDMTGYSMADFMLGLPRQVGTPIEQLWSDVLGWRNGLFVNDSWQATRKVTLNLGLRYELSTPVKTQNGIGSMLNADQTALIPETHPTPGFKFHEPNLKDFAPRVGLAYRATEKTVLRAGFGIYYNPNQMNTFTFLTNNPPLAPEFTFVSDPVNPTLSLSSPFGVTGPGGPPNVITPNRHLPNARKKQWSFDIQRELWEGTALDLQYVGSRTKNLDRSFFNNTPLPGPGPVDQRRPNQRWRVVRTIENDVVGNYDAFSVILRRRLSRGLQASAHYTWSRTYDMCTHSNSGGNVMNDYDIWADYAPADWDVPHRFVASYIYNLPFFTDSQQPIAKAVLSGWQIGGITTLESGRPFNVTIAGDRANVGRPNQRPDLIGTPTANCGGNNLINCIDASAFAVPAQYTFGNAPRNLLRGPGYISADVTVAKNIAIRARGSLQLRGEFFNVFNRANFNNPNGQFGTANFGRIISAQPMRQIRLGAKLTF